MEWIPAAPGKTFVMNMGASDNRVFKYKKRKTVRYSLSAFKGNPPIATLAVPALPHPAFLAIMNFNDGFLPKPCKQAPVLMQILLGHTLALGSLPFFASNKSTA